MALVVLVAVAMSNLMLVGVWRWLDPPGLVPGSLRTLEVELSTALRLLNDADPAARPVLLRGFAGLGIQPVPPGAAPPPGQETPRLLLLLAELLTTRGAVRGVTITGASTGDPDALLITATLADASAVSLHVTGARMRQALPNLLLPPATLLLLLGLPLLLVSIWAAFRLTRPLTELARRAETIGLARDSAALPEAGTREVRQVAGAINRLLERLRRDLAERTRLLAGISHDLRTPLTRLHLRVDAMEDALLRARLMQDVRAMEAMVASSFALLETELRQEPPERIDLAVLAATICDDFADAGHDVSYHGPRHCAIQGQPRGLERALSNLADNAVKYGGAARVRLLAAPGRVSLLVEDQGPGIPEAELPFVTEAFRRVARAGEEAGAPGHGLGLAIVAGVARAHGGQLRLTNLRPHGLRAELMLQA